MLSLVVMRGSVILAGSANGMTSQVAVLLNK